MANFAANQGMVARVIDHCGGSLFKAVSDNESVDWIEFASDRCIDIPADEILVMQAAKPRTFPRQLRLHNDARLFFWQLHPFNFIPNLTPGFGLNSWLVARPTLYNRLLKWLRGAELKPLIRYLTLVSERRAVCFYDRTSVQVTETFLGCHLAHPELIPVPLAVPDAPRRVARIDNECLHIGWVGRFYDFKIHILRHTLFRFANYSRSNRIPMKFHIIGDGPKSADLECSEFEHEFFKIKPMDAMEPIPLHNYLSQNVDIVAAMGRSALEAAALGLPTILLDFSYGPVKHRYRFRWLYETVGFDLGHPITQLDSDGDDDSLGRMIKAIQTDYAEHARRSFDYCWCHHRLETVGSQFLDLVKGSYLFGKDIRDFLGKGLFRKAYERLTE